MAARFGFASSRGHSILGLVASALCVAALLLSPQAVSGQYRLFGTEGFRIGRMEIGFGADYLSELQKSLTISSSSGTVTVHDLEDGSTVTGPLGSDPRLLNRKFDIEWEMDGPGVQIPLSRSFDTGWGKVQTSFSLQAREGDFELRFLNQREPGTDDSLHGRGTFYGAEISVATRCEHCPWFTENGFRFQKLSGANAERSPTFTSPGLRVLGDDSRLSRETRDAFTRFGYSFTGKDVIAYTGVRYRQVDVEVEDELRLFDPQFNQETMMRSRTKLDGSATEAILGIEGQRRLRGRTFLGRTEITFNDRDYGVVATVIYAGPQDRDRSEEEIIAQTSEIAAAIAPGLKYVAEKFFQDLEKLRTHESIGRSEVSWVAELRNLLDSTQDSLRRVLKPYPELSPLVDWATYQFQQVLQELNLGESPSARVALVSLRSTLRLIEQGPDNRDRQPAYQRLWRFGNECLLALYRMAQKDQLLIDLTFTAGGLEPGMTLGIYSPYDSNPTTTTLNAGATRLIKRGMYSFKVYAQGDPGDVCSTCNAIQRDSPCPFDLVLDPYPELNCRPGKKNKCICGQRGTKGATVR